MVDKKRLQIAVVGPGRLGQACALALLGDATLSLVGLVARGGSPAHLSTHLPDPLRHFPVVTHIRDLSAVDVALVCVPSDVSSEVAHDLLQSHVPLVECAQMRPRDLIAHHEALSGAANRYRVRAVLGAGWNPGVLPLLTQAFETLIPHGHSVEHDHPGLTLHHSAEVERLPGVQRALEGEMRASHGELQRYVYVETKRGADFDPVRNAILADPVYAGEATQVFQMDNLADLEEAHGRGWVMERHTVPSPGKRASLVLEARFDPTDFAAQVMIKACRQLPSWPIGAHPFRLEPDEG